MYSLIHMALVRLVSGMEDSEELLTKIFAVAGVGDPKGNAYRSFSDQDSLRLIVTAASVLGMSVDDVIVGMGTVQLDTFADFGYLPLIESLGRTFYEFLLHVDLLHQNLVQSYPSMVAPSFRPVMQPDGRLFLHYYSSRPGLWGYARGLLTVVARNVYDEAVVIEHVQKRHEGHDHDIFSIVHEGHDRFITTSDPVCKELGTKDFVTRSFSAEEVNELFPWHVEFDRSMKVVSMGSALASRFPSLEKGAVVMLADVLKVQRPALVRQDFEGFLDYQGQAFLAMVRDESYHQKNREKVMARRAARAAARGRLSQRPSNGSTMSECPFSAMMDGEEVQMRKRSPSSSSSCSSVHADNFISQTEDYLYIRGELCFQKSTDTIFLAGSPHITKAAEMYERDMGLADIPVHSNGRELLFGSLHASATIAIARTLEDTTESLDIARNEMNREKARVEELLHGILPPSIARQLASGHRPDAERYAGATILFSDVVGFTKLSSSVKPQAVMNMLNELFSKFDDLCDQHTVFKVETIGDAYMVACGLPVPNDQHPIMMCRFALAMIHAAHTVKSPVDGSPLQIRIGMHTGPVMAGVVGLKAPRYCLFGDTVNVASRMESTSVPGCIQMSASLMSELHAMSDKFICRKRGEMEVKGKGQMETFFLLGEGEVIESLIPPESSRGAQGEHSPAPGALPIAMPTFQVKKDEKYYDVCLHAFGTEVSLCGVGGDSPLSELMSTASAAFGQELIALYADAKRTQLLVTSQRVQQLIDSNLLHAKVTGADRGVLTLFSRGRVSLQADL